MKNRFLAGVGHPLRALIFMVGTLVLYCFWLWLLGALGLLTRDTPTGIATFLLVLPVFPVAGFDLWLRITWTPEQPTLHPPPPGLRERLLQRAYGLYWFPVVICIPLWLWGAALLGWIVGHGLQG